MVTRVGIVDYAISNLASVRNALCHIGVEVAVIRDPGEMTGFTHLVLPGVGSFARGMENLHRTGFVTPIRNWARAGRPLLGLCLGMQLLGEEGEEFGPVEGLGLVPGRIVKMRLADTSLRLPHIGWNEVIPRRNGRMLEGLGDSPAFYFVHSYGYAEACADYVTGVCDYGGEQVALIERGNLLGAQFHPEKSQKAGLALLANFAACSASDA